MPRAGPLRYWSLTLLGLLLAAGPAVALAWGLYRSEPVVVLGAVLVGSFTFYLGVVALALRGGRGRVWTVTLGRREKRLADRIARGEVPAPTVGRPAPQEPVPSLTPLNRTWPPATWEPQPGTIATATPPKTQIERLQALDALKSKGLITAAEFEAQRQRILGGI